MRLFKNGQMSHKMTKISLLGSLACFLLCQSTSAFLPSTPTRRGDLSIGKIRFTDIRYSTPDDKSPGEKRELDRLFDEMERQNTKAGGFVDGLKQTVNRLPVPDLSGAVIDTSKPFSFPAYGYLFISVLLGISFTGSLTELATGSPLLGPPLTLAVILGAGPGFIATFVIAVQRFNEEKDEDDRKLEEEERRADANKPFVRGKGEE